MKFYQTKTKKLSGTTYREAYKKAIGFYKEIKSKTKRRPYVRSAYFNKEKIFLETFWHHLHEKKNFRDKARRVKYFPCAIELIEKSRHEPSSKENPNKRSEILHRFAGATKDKELFFVQIREDKRTGQKWLMSVFPFEK
ncbi:hypothetical protein MYX06_04195 [Patescibacteria group bacterium AH-259-L05]|nr:hypothetical protein [Patescibacteria group bacterium AH-259-L05]